MTIVITAAGLNLFSKQVLKRYNIWKPYTSIAREKHRETIPNMPSTTASRPANKTAQTEPNQTKEIYKRDIKETNTGRRQE